ncbi:bifunctional riboflavin kinase/FAD synthetase [Cyanobacteria bacterium FACHB-471]|nr:bifunctional riboflavin kinase/FAD synthetase [Cyanobacteria bacterium FACHB-471]
MWITSSLTTAKSPTLVALGNFDGVHRGHQQVIQPILSAALAAPETGRPTVVTFRPHPQEFFSGQSRPLLTPLDEKASYLSKLGVEQLVLLPFDRALADLTPEQFVETVLVQHLQARQVSVGEDFCFGRKRSGTATDLQAIATPFNIQVQVVPLHTAEGERISSSAIRQALQEGNLAKANQLLGRPYSLVGQVVEGQQLGRTIGFPTANLKLPAEKFLPRQGVYCVWVYLSKPTDPSASNHLAQALPGVMNLGHRPTVGGVQQTVEVHLLDWSGDLYGQTLTVSLAEFLRPEQKFASLEELKAQIQSDSISARSILAAAPAASSGV